MLHAKTVINCRILPCFYGTFVLADAVPRKERIRAKTDQSIREKVVRISWLNHTLTAESQPHSARFCLPGSQPVYFLQGANVQRRVRLPPVLKGSSIRHLQGSRTAASLLFLVHVAHMLAEMGCANHAGRKH